MATLISPRGYSDLVPELRDPIDYRKSGLSLNHIIGCPLDCTYCVRHLFSNFEMRRPRALMPDDEAVERLVAHRFFRPHDTPLQIFNRATDPWLPNVKEHTFRVLDRLDALGLKNHTLVISRWKLTEADCERLNTLKHLRLTLLFTWSGIDDRKIEPVDSDVAAGSLQTARECAVDYKVILYWRPLIPGVNDTERHVHSAAKLSRYAHATAFTGLFFREPIRKWYADNGVSLPYSETARRKILPRLVESRLIQTYKAVDKAAPLFRKTSCAVAYAHGQPDYNGHFGVPELCDICPASQVSICRAAFRPPKEAELQARLMEFGVDQNWRMTPGAVEIEGLDEERRYYLQHFFQYQFHNTDYPHHQNRHGRADIGWDDDT